VVVPTIGILPVVVAAATNLATAITVVITITLIQMADQTTMKKNRMAIIKDQVTTMHPTTMPVQATMADPTITLSLIIMALLATVAKRTRAAKILVLQVKAIQIIIKALTTLEMKSRTLPIPTASIMVQVSL